MKTNSSYLLGAMIVVLCSVVFGSSQVMTRANGSANYNVAIVDYSFRPQSINITTGTKVLWTFLTNGSDSGDLHTVTANNQTQSGGGVFQSSQLHSGQTFEFTFYSPGKYPYHCGFHPYMTGIVNVTGQPIIPPASGSSLVLYVGLSAIAAGVFIGAFVVYYRQRHKGIPRTSP